MTKKDEQKDGQTPQEIQKRTKEQTDRGQWRGNGTIAKTHLIAVRIIIHKPSHPTQPPPQAAPPLSEHEDAVILLPFPNLTTTKQRVKCFEDCQGHIRFGILYFMGSTFLPLTPFFDIFNDDNKITILGHRIYPSWSSSSASLTLEASNERLTNDQRGFLNDLRR